MSQEQQKWTAPPKGPEGDKAAEEMMNALEKELSKKYAVIADRMAEMGITGQIELSWPQAKISSDIEEQKGKMYHSLLKGIINENKVELWGPLVDEKERYRSRYGLKTKPIREGGNEGDKSFDAQSYSGTINGVRLDSKTAREMFGIFMGLSIDKEEENAARQLAAEERAKFLIDQLSRFRGKSFAYPTPK